METTQPGAAWYRVHPLLAIGVCVVLYAGVSGLHFAADSSGEAVSVLYALPIALLAVTFGRWGGWVGAIVGFGLFAAFAVFHNLGDLDLTGWLVRAAALLLLGVLLGGATDKARESARREMLAEKHRAHMEDVARREREALEINDSIIQGMAAAKWLIERGETDQAVEVLAAAIDRGTSVVASLLPRRMRA